MVESDSDHIRKKNMGWASLISFGSGRPEDSVPCRDSQRLLGVPECSDGQSGGEQGVQRWGDPVVL